MTVFNNVSQNFVFVPPDQGKPDPKEWKPETGCDSRARIVQNANKYNVCWYMAFNMIRERYKAPNTQNLQERKFEKLSSLRRKDVSAHEKSLPDITDQLNSAHVIKYFSQMTKKTIQEPFNSQVIKMMDEGAEHVTISSVLPPFLAQDKWHNLYDYLRYLKLGKRGEIAENFLSKIQINPEVMYENFLKNTSGMCKNALINVKWLDLPLMKKSALLDIFTMRASAEHYGLKISSWHPKQPIESLMEQLQARGPHVVSGAFGRGFYGVPPRKLNKKIEGRDVFGWIKTDPKLQAVSSGHTMVLVGAEIRSNQGVVYYVDPDDGSDPKSPEKQRIFTMSYERLTSPDNICDTYGVMQNDSPPEVGYAFAK